MYKPYNIVYKGNQLTSDDNTSIKAKLDDEDLPQSCVHFDFCSANLCPLDPFISKRSSGPGDPKCDMPKGRRHSYWLKMTPEQQALLPYQGYSEGEFTRKQAHDAKWAAMSKEEKAVILEKLAKLRERRRILAATAPQPANDTSQEPNP